MRRRMGYDLHLERTGRNKKRPCPYRQRSRLQGPGGRLPAPPGIEPHPELTTAPLRLAPLKLLPFGGPRVAARAGRLQHTAATVASCRVPGAGVRAVPRRRVRVMAGIAILHFTLPGGAPIIRPVRRVRRAGGHDRRNGACPAAVWWFGTRGVASAAPRRRCERCRRQYGLIPGGTGSVHAASETRRWLTRGMRRLPDLISYP